MNERPWIEEKLAHPRERRLQYLGSFPTMIATTGEVEREDFIARSALAIGLMLHIDHRDGRRYVFVESHFLMHPGHYPSVTQLEFGELETRDSDGFVCTIPPQVGCHNDNALPMSSWQGPHPTDEEWFAPGGGEEANRAYWRSVGLDTRRHSRQVAA